jgi:hypothetical protein
MTTTTPRKGAETGTAPPAGAVAQQPEEDQPLRLDLTENLRFTLAHLRRQRTVVLGQSGTGKSNTVAAIAEEGLRHRIPMSIVDPESEYWSLKSLYDILVVGRSPHADLEVAAEHMGQLAEWSVRQGVSVVIDLGDYTDEEAFALLVPYFQRLWMVCSHIRRDYMVVIDEAQDFIPQSGKTPLKGQLIRIAKKGRKRRIWSVFATQRPQSVDKDYLTQTDLRILHAVSYKHDLEVYADIIPVLPGADPPLAVQKLGKGQAYAIYDHVPYLVQIRRRDSFDPNEEPSPGTQIVEPTLRPLDDAMLQELRDRLAAPPDAERMEKEQLLKRIGELESLLRGKTPASARRAARTGHSPRGDEEEIGRLRVALAEREGVIAEKEELILQLTTRLEAQHTAPRSLEIGLATVREVHLGAAEHPLTAQSQGAAAGEVERLRTALAQADQRILQLEQELLRWQEQREGVPTYAVPAQLGGQPTEAQRRKLKSLIGRLNPLSRFQRALLHLLLERGEGDVSYEALSRALHYTLLTVTSSSTTSLQREGLIEHATTVPGYRLCFAAYCAGKYPGVDPGLVRDLIYTQLVTN